ncbi:uncharacterized protein [Ptychodera flava]|uniref:uncharacterized protein n=1 Tax=Ptychodera flava TaxID=63121 RepID=UPI00396A112B
MCQIKLAVFFTIALLALFIVTMYLRGPRRENTGADDDASALNLKYMPIEKRSFHGVEGDVLPGKRERMRKNKLPRSWLLETEQGIDATACTRGHTKFKLKPAFYRIRKSVKLTLILKSRMEEPYEVHVELRDARRHDVSETKRQNVTVHPGTSDNMHIDLTDVLREVLRPQGTYLQITVDVLPGESGRKDCPVKDAEINLDRDLASKQQQRRTNGCQSSPVTIGVSDLINAGVGRDTVSPRFVNTSVCSGVCTAAGGREPCTFATRRSCAPTVFSDLIVTYKDRMGIVKVKKYKNAVVEECGCLVVVQEKSADYQQNNR